MIVVVVGLLGSVVQACTSGLAVSGHCCYRAGHNSAMHTPGLLHQVKQKSLAAAQKVSLVEASNLACHRVGAKRFP